MKNTENILKKKKARINPALHIYIPFLLCNIYLAKSCGVFVLFPELCLSPAARLPLQSCLNFHHLGTQAHKCPKIKQVLPLAAAAGEKKTSFTFIFCLAKSRVRSFYQLCSPHVCLPHTSKDRECFGYKYLMVNLIIAKS